MHITTAGRRRIRRLNLRSSERRRHLRGSRNDRGRLNRCRRGNRSGHRRDRSSDRGGRRGGRRLRHLKEAVVVSRKVAIGEQRGAVLAGGAATEDEEEVAVTAVAVILVGIDATTDGCRARRERAERASH